MAVTKELIHLSKKDLALLNTKQGLVELLRSKEIKLTRTLNRLHYYDTLLTWHPHR